MNRAQQLFLIQARSDFEVFQRLFDLAPKQVPASHALHYLQMSTELLGKSWSWRYGPPRYTHRAFVRFVRELKTNRIIQRRLGFEYHNDQWSQMIRSSAMLAEQIEHLAPQLAQNGPNPEYPWPPADPEFAPVGFHFPVWRELSAGSQGRRFRFLLHDLFTHAEEYL